MKDTFNGKNQVLNEQKETYQLIIDTAEKLFMQYGYRAVSTRQIAELCGITQPALYHHFKSKQSIFVEVINQMLSHISTNLFKIIKKHNDAKSRLYDAVYYMLGSNQVDLAQLFHDMFHELNPKNQEVVYQNWVKSFLTPVIMMIDGGVKNGEIKDPLKQNISSAELAYFILNMIKSMMQPTVRKTLDNGYNDDDIQNKSRMIVQILLNGIAR